MKSFQTISTPLGLTAVFSVLMVTLAIGAEVVSVDRHLVKYDSGVVYDVESGLEWYAGPDRGTSWEEAERWVAGLDTAEGEWRMPTKDELDTLGHVGDGVSNITVLLANSGYWIWAGQTADASSQWVFGFSYGGEGWCGMAPADGGRAIAVRYRKKQYSAPLAFARDAYHTTNAVFMIRGRYYQDVPSTLRHIKVRGSNDESLQMTIPTENGLSLGLGCLSVEMEMPVYAWVVMTKHANLAYASRYRALTQIKLVIVQSGGYGSNMHNFLPRAIANKINRKLLSMPAVAILGPRQAAKTTPETGVGPR